MREATKLRILGGLFAAILGLAMAGPSFGQAANNGQQTQRQVQGSNTQPQDAALNKPGTNGDILKGDPAEEEDYKSIVALKPTDYDQQITLGEAFVTKWVNSRYREGVYAELMHAYFQKQDFAKMYDTGEKALAINPDDVSVLVQLGWVTPHNYDPNDPDSAKKLEKAEAELKHGLEVLDKMQKPANMADDVFAKSKASATEQAHSGLGLVYFREGKPTESASELELGSTNANPDPSDLYVLGRDYETLKRFGDASTAYTKCAAINGPLQSRCKQRADQTKQQATAQPAAKP